MRVLIYITKIVLQFMMFVAIDNLWTRTKTRWSNRKRNLVVVK